MHLPTDRSERVLRHMAVYLIGSQQSYATLLQQIYRFGEICCRISDGLAVSRQPQAFCWDTHFVNGIKEPCWANQGDDVALLRPNKERVRYFAREKHAFSRSDREDVAFYIKHHRA